MRICSWNQLNLFVLHRWALENINMPKTWLFVELQGVGEAPLIIFFENSILIWGFLGENVPDTMRIWSWDQIQVTCTSSVGSGEYDHAKNLVISCTTEGGGFAVFPFLDKFNLFFAFLGENLPDTMRI